jgi:hypothetical protein
VKQVRGCTPPTNEDESLQKSNSEDFPVAPSAGDESVPTVEPVRTFDHRLSEGQNRRNAMADCESECSAINDHLFVSGRKVSA